MNSTTHTYVTVELSPTAFGEIKRALKTAGYDHAFHGSGSIIDMHGLAVVEVQPPRKLVNPSISIDRASKRYAVFDDDFTCVREFQPYTNEAEAIAEAKEWVGRHVDTWSHKVPVVFPGIKRMTMS